MDEPTVLEQVASILTLAATLFGIGTAIYGINAWRREHIGKRKIELAEDALAAFYEAADAIDAIRHPFSSSAETEAIEKAPQETEAQFEARKNASVVFVRYNAHSELFSRLHAMRYRFMAQIGRDQAKPFSEIRAVLNEITVSARMLSRLWARDHFRTDEQREQHYSNIERHERVFWAGVAEEDDIAKRVQGIIQRLEVTCKSVIDGHGQRRFRLRFWK